MKRLFAITAAISVWLTQSSVAGGSCRIKLIPGYKQGMASP